MVYYPIEKLQYDDQHDASTLVNIFLMMRIVTVTSKPPTVPADEASCYSSLVADALDDESARRLAGIFKALGDPTRLKLISLIGAGEDAEACICDLTDPVGLSQPTVSHHMKVLAEAGLIAREQRGKWAYFRLVGDVFDALVDTISRSSLGAGGEVQRRPRPRG